MNKFYTKAEQTAHFFKLKNSFQEFNNLSENEVSI